MLLISSQVFCMYCVLPEDGQVGRNMPKCIINSENNKYLIHKHEGESNETLKHVLSRNLLNTKGTQ